MSQRLRLQSHCSYTPGKIHHMVLGRCDRWPPPRGPTERKGPTLWAMRDRDEPYTAECSRRLVSEFEGWVGICYIFYPGGGATMIQSTTKLLVLVQKNQTFCVEILHFKQQPIQSESCSPRVEDGHGWGLWHVYVCFWRLRNIEGVMGGSYTMADLWHEKGVTEENDGCSTRSA